MSKKTITTYYCDRCGKEIPFEHVKPEFVHYLILGNSWGFLYESKDRYYELCHECGKKLAKFIENEEPTD